MGVKCSPEGEIDWVGEHFGGCFVPRGILNRIPLDVKDDVSGGGNGWTLEREDVGGGREGERGRMGMGGGFWG